MTKAHASSGRKKKDNKTQMPDVRGGTGYMEMEYSVDEVDQRETTKNEQRK